MKLTPLTLWTIFFVLGIAAGNGAGEALVFYLLAIVFGLCGGLLWWRTRTWSRVFLFLIAFFLGALHVATAQIISADHISRVVTGEKKRVVLEGEVISDPRVLKTQTSFIARVDHYRSGEKRGVVRGRVWVRCFAPVPFLRGDRWLLEGFLSKPSGILGRFMKAQAASAILNIPKSGRLTRLSQRGVFFRKWSPDAMAKEVGLIFSGQMDPMPAGLYRAMILGEKRMVPKKIKDMMVKTGTWHIMVVSGSHTAFLAGILLVLFKMFHVPRPVRFALTFFTLLFYCFMTGASSPVVRATVMTTVILLSFIVERNPVLLHSLALAALVIFAFDPLQLFDVGFQLSFLSVLSIVLLSPRLMPHAWMKKVSRWPRMTKDFLFGLVNCFVVSFSAWAGTAPLIFFTFNTFAPVAILANTAVVPLAIMVTASGFAMVPIALLIPAAAPFFAKGAVFFMELFIRVNSWFL